MHDADDRQPTSVRPAVKTSAWWWLRQLLLSGIAGFFTFFGISLLVAAYRLGDPFSFIMTFFAACLIILISAVMAVAFILRIGAAIRAGRTVHDQDRRS